MTGSMPGIAASTRETWEFGALPNAVDAPENSLAFDVTCACTSMPMTTSQSPLAAHHNASSTGESRSGGAGSRIVFLKESGVIGRVPCPISDPQVWPSQYPAKFGSILAEIQTMGDEMVVLEAAGGWSSIVLSFRAFGVSHLPPPFRRKSSRRLLEHVPKGKQALLIERPADQLQPERKPIAVEPGRNRDAGQTRHVHGDGEHVIQIHFDRIAGRFLAERECGGRRCRGQHRMDPGIETGLEI